MERSEEKLKADLKLLEQAGQTLQQALSEPLTDIVRDAVIQRFEYVFELSWKTIQAAGDYVGTRVESPRQAVKAGFKNGWIQNADAWLEALEARNLTSHTYNRKLADQVYAVAKNFPALVDELISSFKSALP